MSVRKNHRAVMAELLLLGNPVSIRVRGDRVSMAVDFDSIADLKSWLHLAGLDDPNLLTNQWDGTTEDGRPYRQMNAWPTWHGWKFYADATDYTDAEPLDTDTAARLAALAEATR